MSLHDYTDAPEPLFKAQSLIKHPVDILKVIGFICRDLRRGETVAVFKRNRHGTDAGNKHYFEKYAGYAVSAEVLLDIYDRGIETVYVLEQDGDHRLIEYDIQQFSNDATTVVYDTAENTISNVAMHVAREQTRYDVQKVLPDDRAKRVWPGEGVSIE